MNYRWTFPLALIFAAACGSSGTTLPSPGIDAAAEIMIDVPEGDLRRQGADGTEAWSTPDIVEIEDALDEPELPGEDLFEAAPELPDLVEVEEVPDLLEIAPDIDILSTIVPCQTHEDCKPTGICLESHTGGKLCYPWCESQEDCPADYLCLLPNGFEDTACFPAQPNLCKPCTKDVDCSPPSYELATSCIDFAGAGLFCGAECQPLSDGPCPEGYECAALPGTSDEYRCMTLPGFQCECESYMEGTQTGCFNQNELGKCEGTRGCLDDKMTACSALSPSSEDCDGLDNDCDGETDEVAELKNAPECVLEYDAGACQIFQYCLNGKWKCPNVGFQDICTVQELDCIWWGGVTDSDKDEWPDFCDPDDDNDGSEDQDDCKPLDPGVHPGAFEECDGIDSDCNGVSDYDQLEADPCLSESEWGTCNGFSYCIDGDWHCKPDPPGPDHCLTPDEDCQFFPMPEESDLDQDLIPDFCDDDVDGDDVLDGDDNCPLVYNPNQFDLEEDGLGDPCDDDDDNDAVTDGKDCCPYIYNPTQAESDDDGSCDACDDDDDNDGIDDVDDNCHYVKNPNQENFDKDDKGDHCDVDDDNDSVEDITDNCLFVPNLFQLDLDQDGIGDACDDDDDNDGIPDDDDNCPMLANELQVDLDEDEIGDACDDDLDGDKVPNDSDNCPVTSNPDQKDTDDDGEGDACSPDIDGDDAVNDLDNCPLIPNADQLDTDDDCPPTPYPKDISCGDQCDPDLDGDGIPQDGDASGEAGDNLCKSGDTVLCDDNCPAIHNPDQADLNGDGKGDACVDDKDGDGVVDDDDNCAKSPNPQQEDQDEDGLGDACDADDDGDKVYDIFDNCPLVPNPEQIDTDEDGKGDACDDD